MRNQIILNRQSLFVQNWTMPPTFSEPPEFWRRCPLLYSTCLDAPQTKPFLGELASSTLLASVHEIYADYSACVAFMYIDKMLYSSAAQKYHSATQDSAKTDDHAGSDSIHQITIGL
jgi:hypothetical protein